MTFEVVFSKPCDGSEKMFNKIVSRTHHELLGDSQQTFYFFGVPLEAGQQLEVNLDEFKIEVVEWTTPDGKDISLKYLRHK